ncbi:MAG: exo-alpha-sialidase, partial [Verrucomicrobia bacterium]|nr:exo-alpha-sialidase [Verrucomicrobiota bacterium]
NGTSSKPTFDRFDGLYYLGWQEATKIGGVGRSVFNIDVSRDGSTWERKYRFETEKSFQYPTFRKYDGAVYLTVTQGDSSPSRKERIMFGRLE